MNGYGIFKKLDDGYKHEGQYKLGKQHGYIKATYPDGEIEYRLIKDNV